jgi:hypothetical protein
MIACPSPCIAESLISTAHHGPSIRGRPVARPRCRIAFIFADPRHAIPFPATSCLPSLLPIAPCPPPQKAYNTLMKTPDTG